MNMKTQSFRKSDIDDAVSRMLQRLRKGDIELADLERKEIHRRIDVIFDAYALYKATSGR